MSTLKPLKIQKGLFSFENILALIFVLAHQILTFIQIFLYISYWINFKYLSKSCLKYYGNQVISQNASSIENCSILKVYFSRKFIKFLETSQ